MDFSFLSNTMLFRGTSAEDAEAMLGCLGSYEKAYEKGSVILRAGECVDSMGMVLSGSVNIEIDDLWGNHNLLQISAQKNLALSRRSLHTSSKSIRGRLLSYLSEQAKHNGSYQFTIPFNRQQLADYLGVDRSAMSNELSKMQSESILTYDKNSFNLARK